MKRLSPLVLLLLLTSCVTNYYYVTINEETPIYSRMNTDSNEITTVPTNAGVYISDYVKGYRKIKYGKYKGYVKNPAFSGIAEKPGTSTSSASSYRFSTTTQSSGGPVNVRGYYRKNGTYVQPHTRSAPHRH